jgi:hypothetical protein
VRLFVTTRSDARRGAGLRDAGDGAQMGMGHRCGARKGASRRRSASTSCRTTRATCSVDAAPAQAECGRTAGARRRPREVGLRTAGSELRDATARASGSATSP